MATPLPHEQAMVHAKVALMDDPKAMFLYNVCFHLAFKWSDKIQTASVDGYTMTFNPAFWMKIDHQMRMSTLAHETGHIIHQHIHRVGNKDKKLYNFAGDYVINQGLKDSGFKPIKWTLDDGRDTKWLQDDRFRDMTTEAVYAILLAEQPPPEEGGGGSGSGQGASQPGDEWLDITQPDTDLSGNPVTAEEISAHIDEILISAVNAVTMAGNPGCIPGDVQLYLDSLLKPKLPMGDYLRRFFQAVAKNDYTWRRPNRRFMPMYLPSMHSEALTHIAFAFDMSCSVQDGDIKRYVSELVGVMRNLKPDKLTLILFDTEVRSVSTIKSVSDLMKVKLIGRGGTDIGPVLEWATKHNPHALCVFTDGEFYSREAKPRCPILWMIHNKRRKFTWPFGQVVNFEV